MDLDNFQKALTALIGAKLFTQDGRQFAVVPDEHTIQPLEAFREHPDRVTTSIDINGIDSFLAYVNRFKNSASSVFVTPNLTKLGSGATLATAYIDYHENLGNGETEANWLSHTASLYARPSLPYAKLIDLDGKLLDQPTFAQALEDIARFSSSHAAADLVEVARTISLTSKGDFKSFEDELSGSVDFKFDLAVRASAGTQERRLTVPSIISFEIPLIDGLSSVGVQTKFVYRVPEGPGGRVSLGVKIVDRAWIEEAAIREAADKIAEATELPVYVGTVSNSGKSY